jgi:hypothetical protein
MKGLERDQLLCKSKILPSSSFQWALIWQNTDMNIIQLDDLLDH